MLMRTELRKLRLQQLDAFFDEIRKSLGTFKTPRKGWIREVRGALGMTSEQLAKRLAVSQPSAFALEKSEQDRTIALQSLEKAANAMDCELVYVFVPRTSLRQSLGRQAEQYARNRVSSVAHTMSLEEQGISEGHIQRQVSEMADQILSNPPRKLWA